MSEYRRSNSSHSVSLEFRVAQFIQTECSFVTRESVKVVLNSIPSVSREIISFEITLIYVSGNGIKMNSNSVWSMWTFIWFLSSAACFFKVLSRQFRNFIIKNFTRPIFTNSDIEDIEKTKCAEKCQLEKCQQTCIECCLLSDQRDKLGPSYLSFQLPHLMRMSPWKNPRLGDVLNISYLWCCLLGEAICYL